MQLMDRLDLYHHIILNEGAYFYHVGLKRITNQRIEDVFSEVREGGKYNTLTKIVRKPETIGVNDEDEVRCSLLVFRRVVSTPAMFDFTEDNAPKEVCEAKIAYLMIVEIRDYVVIVKKNIAHLSEFVDSLVPVSAKTIAGLLVDDTTTFQQMKLGNMNTCPNAIRSKSYEANNLQNSMPMFGTNQNIVTTVRFVNDVNGVCAVNVGTSRIAKFGDKKEVASLLEWMDALVRKIENYRDQETFLSRFAMPRDWKEVKDQLQPTSLLINVFDLQNYIEEKLDDKEIYRRDGKDNFRQFTDCFWRMFKNGSECLELTQTSPEQFTYKSVGVSKRANGMSLVAKKPVDTIYYRDKDENFLTVRSLINTNHFFTVCFSDFSYVYAYGKLYKNSEIDKDFDSILAVLQPVEAIGEVKTEKGDEDVDRTEFSDDSIFHVVEHVLYDDAEILLCDDMGNEWADHIAIRGDTISFIHSKYKNFEKDKGSLSASNFQDVIGQAIKNIGNMTPNDAALKKKIDSMNGMWKKTAIRRCRRGNVGDIEPTYKRLMSNPNKKREVCLVVNFLSKIGLRDAFGKIKNGDSFQQKNSVIQLAWILNGFISTCKQADLDCKIYCME